MLNFAKTRLRTFIFLCFPFITTHAAMDQSHRSVWVNEAIISVYTYDYKNFIQRQQEIGKYFSSEGWINYSKAFNASGLPKIVQEKNYSVSSVATLPPTIKTLSPNHWQATLPILVLYTNPQQKQKQSLTVTIDFQTAAEGQGIRGLAITSLQARKDTEPCVCAPVGPAQ